MSIHGLAAAVAFAACVGTAHAGVIVIDGFGGPVVMNSKSVGGVFGTASPDFSSAALAAIHSDLHASGIVTDGWVTSVLLDTDAGLTFAFLVDDENQPGDFIEIDSELGVTTTGPDTASVWVNDEATDILFRQDLGNGNILASGLFSWDGERDGDAFAWGGLVPGDFVAFNLADRDAKGLRPGKKFQWVNWTGSDWVVVADAGFSGNGNFAFTFTVAPAPGAFALLGTAGFLGRSRRRRA